jgi:hypothetical protein
MEVWEEFDYFRKFVHSQTFAMRREIMTTVKTLLFTAAAAFGLSVGSAAHAQQVQVETYAGPGDVQIESVRWRRSYRPYVRPNYRSYYYGPRYGYQPYYQPGYYGYGYPARSYYFSSRPGVYYW